MALVGPRTRLDALVARYPSVEEVLHWHAIGFSARDLMMTVEGFCEANRSDLAQVMVDLRMAVEDALEVERDQSDPGDVSDPDEGSVADASYPPLEEDDEESVPEGVSIDDAGVEEDLT